MVEPTPALGAEDRRLDQFEEAWLNHTPPTLEQFVPPVSGKPAAGRERCELLRELIKIDLDHRWRRRMGDGKLENYLLRYPELRGREPMLLELIGEEFRSRGRWGECVRPAEYAGRFPELWSRLEKLLARVAAELRAELAKEGRRVSSSEPSAGPVAPPRGTSMAQPVQSSAELVQCLRQCRLVDPAQATEAVLVGLCRRWPESRSLAKELLQRGWLTPFQVNQLLMGKAAELAVGPYVLLERLGQGGAGQVFKARHLHMNRVVAFKTIHKESLADSEALARFQREIHALSQLTHPNIVHAYDAGPVGPNFFLAMEYVDGIDLSVLVKKNGPLAIHQACDYIRQAAVGLQYIHERGLTHRDIKPSNLLVTQAEGPEPPGLVKILDLGLAGLRRPIDNSTGLTAAGTVMMGTVDYMAPEQALDFHRADIRADVYSLGCTLYFLLAGRPPFVEGTAAQKLLLHQMKEPVPAEELRRDVPPALAQLIHRMMAKRPEDRIQSPREVAQLLEGFCADKPPGTALVPAPPRPVVVMPLVPSGNRPLAIAAEVIDSRPGPVANRMPLRLALPRRKRLALGIVGGLAAALVAAFILRSVLSGSKTSPDAAPAFLADLPLLGKSGDGEFWKGGKWGKDPEKAMVAGGSPAPKGILMRPEGGGRTNGSIQASFRLDGQYRRFKVTACLEDRFARNARGSAVLKFAIAGNDRKIWESRPLSKLGDSDQCSLDVSGIDKLELFVSYTGGFPSYESAILGLWVDPELTRK